MRKWWNAMAYLRAYIFWVNDIATLVGNPKCSKSELDFPQPFSLTFRIQSLTPLQESAEERYGYEGKRIARTGFFQPLGIFQSSPGNGVLSTAIKPTQADKFLPNVFVGRLSVGGFAQKKQRCPCFLGP